MGEPVSNPWFKFYPTDWRADPALRMCSPAARGVWIDMICLMHEATPYGHLLVNGRGPTDAQLAVLLGLPPAQLSELKGELESAGVFSLTKEGAIYSRKMTRSAKKAATARNNGRKGGNPSLTKQRENSASDNPKVKGGVKPQKPEARSQILDLANAKSCPFDEFWRQWPVKISKENARKAWAKLKAPDREAALAAVVAGWFERWQSANPTANPIHASSFLNQKRWTDQTPAPKGETHGRPSQHRGNPHADTTLDAIAIAARMRRTPGAVGN